LGSPPDLHSFPTRRSSDLLLLLAGLLQIDELVARFHEQRRGGLLHRKADHQPVVLPQLVGERAEVAVAGSDRERVDVLAGVAQLDRKSTRLNSSHVAISYA